MSAATERIAVIDVLASFAVSVQRFSLATFCGAR